MADIIQLLPDSVANQIAAGEVIQRPSSVVKELLENAIDAGASEISLKVIDAGKTLIQVTDNGCGMSETDARMSFERHATSKIKVANDLFAILTMGFRGEALASIGAVADVTVKTKRTEDEVGTSIHIAGSKVISQEEIGCPNGTTFVVKNLFFNIPARRKFLKSNSTELRHIIHEFQRVTLTNPDIRFSFDHKNTSLYNLTVTNTRQRIVQVFGKSINQNLIDIKTDTTLIKIYGYIGKPESAKKTFGEQFFFINNRFMKHPYFHKAILNAYDKLLPKDTFPTYFIYFTAEPESIDINIHPTKTEIKFENEQAIFQILQAAIKEALGKFNIMPSIDFDTEGAIDIPVIRKDSSFKAPEVNIDPDYDPFSKETEPYSRSLEKTPLEKTNLQNWESLYKGISNKESEINTNLLPADDETQVIENHTKFFQLKNKYLLTPVKSGLMVIDQRRAHERILYESCISSLKNSENVAQQSLFPKTVVLNPDDHTLFMDILEDINKLGFDIRDFGNHTLVVNAHPAYINNFEPKAMLEGFIENFKSAKENMGDEIHENVAVSVARASAIGYGQALSQEETRELIDNLFACEQPNYSPTGKPIVTIIELDEIDKKLK